MITYIAFLSKYPNKCLINFAEKLSEYYKVFIIIDDNSKKYQNNNTKVTFIQINNEICIENNYKYAKKVNYSGTKNLVDSLVKYKKKIKSVFFASTSHVYKIQNKDVKINENQKLEPYSKYGKTKLLAENYFRENLKKNKINHCIGRIFSYTDPKQNKTFLAPSLFYKIKKSNKQVINFKGLNHYRDFISMGDISKIIFILYKKK